MAEGQGEGERGKKQEARFLLNALAKQLADDAHNEAGNEAGNEASGALIDNPRRDANLILQMALQSQEPVLMHHDITLDEAAERRLADFMARRLAGEPISRMRGWREFYSLDFILNEETLDPRPDSEVLVDAAIAHCGDAPYRIADFGTGSGCLLIAVLANCQKASGVGLDLSARAIAQATHNAAHNKVAERARFAVSDWDSALDDEARFEVILSNPPYIPTGDEMSLSPEVRLHDPHLALFAGEDGLDCYRIVMGIFAKRLTSPGVCFVEIGKGQEAGVEAIARKAGLVPMARLTDLSGIIRVLKFCQK